MTEVGKLTIAHAPGDDAPSEVGEPSSDAAKVGETQTPVETEVDAAVPQDTSAGEEANAVMSEQVRGDLLVTICL